MRNFFVSFEAGEALRRIDGAGTDVVERGPANITHNDDGIVSAWTKRRIMDTRRYVARHSPKSSLSFQMKRATVPCNIDERNIRKVRLSCLRQHAH
jgi:hypothetical protein